MGEIKGKLSFAALATDDEFYISVMERKKHQSKHQKLTGLCKSSEGQWSLGGRAASPGLCMIM